MPGAASYNRLANTNNSVKGATADDLGGRTRQDNSLGELTRKFIALI